MPDQVYMLTTDDITLRALRAEHERLSKAAAKAKAEVDEYLNAGSESIAIHKEFMGILNSKAHGPKIARALDDLKRRQARVDRLQKKDLLALMDRQHEAELEQSLAAEAIGGIQFRLSFRKTHE